MAANVGNIDRGISESAPAKFKTYGRAKLEL